MNEMATSRDKAAPKPGPLPVWNLSHLYESREASALNADLRGAEQAALGFHARYAGKLSDLDGEELAAAIVDYETIDETLGRVMSYAYLVYADDMSDGANGRFLQTMQERVTSISSNLLFFTLELNRLDQADLDALMTVPALKHYEPWLRDVRVFRDHQLSDEVERLLHEKAVAGRNAWGRLFDETIAELRFPVDGRQMTSTEALNCLTDRSPGRRREAAEAIGEVLGQNARLFAHITNTLAKDKQIEDTWRRFAEPWSARNLSNFVEDSVVDALLKAVRAAYPALAHRYYAMKARWFGSDQIDYWDRNAPLPDDDDRTIPWPEAERIVLDAYQRFTPDLAAIGQRFFAEGWIDAPARPGKAPGAFAHPTVPSAHPYILLNYQGKTRDVMTLAHELGHGVHQVLAGAQGHLMADTPLTLAETASVFGEMLTFRSLIDGETNARRRKIMLASKVEDMLNTVVRQIAFYEFERRVHSERRQGELSAERLGAIWLDVQRTSLGPAIRFDDAYAIWWAYIPHFIHSPFYVYAYAFGDCLVNSLYAVYQQSGEGFAAKYIDLLRAGGTMRHRELLAPFGLDATNPQFWQQGLNVIRGLIDELAAMDP
ncbi:MAG: M3 family oligoendopeptidase [Rhodospirillaceae bacterium]|nr:M3 family oligoendopeptidase [Rhodospirillaceae bacterium]